MQICSKMLAIITPIGCWILLPYTSNIDAWAVWKRKIGTSPSSNCFLLFIWIPSSWPIVDLNTTISILPNVINSHQLTISRPSCWAQGNDVPRWVRCSRSCCDRSGHRMWGWRRREGILMDRLPWDHWFHGGVIPCYTSLVEWFILMTFIYTYIHVYIHIYIYTQTDR